MLREGSIAPTASSIASIVEGASSRADSSAWKKLTVANGVRVESTSGSQVTVRGAGSRSNYLRILDGGRISIGALAVGLRPDEQAGDQVMAALQVRSGGSIDPEGFAGFVDALPDGYRTASALGAPGKPASWRHWPCEWWVAPNLSSVASMPRRPTTPIIGIASLAAR